MRMKEFTEKLANEVEARLNGVKVTPTKNWKNNSVVLHGLTICKEGENVAPILYIDQFFKRFEKGELSVGDIVEQVVCDYEKLSIPEVPDLESLLSSDGFINKINLRMVNLDMNRDMIDERQLLYRKVEDTDLACLFYANIFTEEDSVGAIGLTETLLKKYLPTIDNVETLFQLIINNVHDEHVTLESIKSVISKMVVGYGLDMSEVEKVEDILYVFSNTERQYGVSGMGIKIK